MALTRFIAPMSGAGRHVHLEGSIRPETLLARHHNIALPDIIVEEICTCYRFTGFSNRIS